MIANNAPHAVLWIILTFVLLIAALVFIATKLASRHPPKPQPPGTIRITTRNMDPKKFLFLLVVSSASSLLRGEV